MLQFPGKQRATALYYYSLGWYGFLSVYRRHPEAFLGTGEQGWRPKRTGRAFRVLRRAMEAYIRI